ncbi:MAG: diguanylate cyclase [Ruminococcus sp.]|nr:diguanylate cyclase [Ruminococcus sp.]
MTVWGYLEDHWSLLVLLVGMAVVLFSDIHLERRMIRRIAAANIMMFLYSVSCYAEAYLGDQPEYNVLRPILSAFNYSFITFIFVTIIMIMYPDQKLYLFFPAVLNAVLCFVSIPTGIVFSIDKNNHFQRGILGYLTYFINGLYLLYVILKMLLNSRSHKEELSMVVFLSLTSVLCLIIPLFSSDSTSHWFNMTIAVDVIIYYVFLLQQFTKKDPLTKLLNRQSYYSDAEKYAEHITAVVAIDINGLKKINDREGHEAGDTALRELAVCFGKAADRRQRVYRIGGDEYVILCVGDPESEVLSLIDRIRQEVSGTPYTCSVGYAMKTEDSTLDKLYQLADAMLYEDKKQYYEKTGKDRCKRRT